ncbi:hypothetical protein GALMADRAFT_158061 [Galerina marginata CBS 339.88]|uniref:Uncharacterized protein n=1 Tax=Galerina marginata (strain CBS 339.88) TaxID=685588 RepID=A0A067T3H2_GALM3|nr:hypothetical protein GALMADRAFT_158061 [Galerina marginata CBS 339.88]
MPSVLETDLEDDEIDQNDRQIRHQSRPNKQLFRDEDHSPIAFFLHKCIKNVDQVLKLKQDIQRHGGRLVANAHEANTVLVNRSLDQSTIQYGYNGATDTRLHEVYVEYTTFIQHCIRCNRFAHRPPTRQRMGGRPPGRTRIEFTDEDDDNLCHFLANVMPYKASGGRQGLNVYIRLVKLSKDMPDLYPWAARHTPGSWKERYKKKAHIFDDIIADMVAKNPPSQKQLWHEDRQLLNSRKRKQHVVELDSDGEEIERSGSEEEQEQEQDMDEEASYRAPSRKRRRSERTSNQSNPWPAAKRARVSGHHRQGSPKRPTSRDKGKARAMEEEEEEEEEEELHGTSLFSDPEYDTMPNEPGPSEEFYSTERTLVASAPTHRNRPVTPPPFSQQTMLDAAGPGSVSSTVLDSSNAANRGRDGVRISQGRRQEPAPSSQAFASLIPPRQHRSSQGASGSAQSSPQHVPPPRNQSQRSANIPQPTPPPPPPEQPRNPSYEQPRKAARRPPTAATQSALEGAAPYTNTRSRSRSVKPSALPPMTRPRKQKTQKETIIEVVEATDAEGPEQNVLVDRNPLPSAETVVEEMVVEQLLKSTEKPPNRSARENIRSSRDMSLETDDAQTAHNLRAKSTVPKVGPAKGFSSLRVRPSDMLNIFDDADSFSSRYSRPVNNRVLNRSSSTVRSDLSGLHQNGPPRSLRKSGLLNLNTSDPHTPAKRLRMGSTSSVDSFPPAGTRASAYKKSILQQEKRTPYKPPEGTRAAELAKPRATPR